MNFVLALICNIILNLMVLFVPSGQFTSFLYMVVLYAAELNVGLMCFNLIPIPPLDGSKVLLELLPYRYRDIFYQIERYSSFILMALLFTNVLTPVLGTMRSFVNTIIYSIVGLIF